MLERAQALKRKNNLEIEKGKKVSNPISAVSLVDIAASISVAIPTNELDGQRIVKQMLGAELDRNRTFNNNCGLEGCSSKCLADTFTTDSEFLPQSPFGDAGCSSVGTKHCISDS